MPLFNVFILTSSSHLILTLSVNTFFLASHHHRPHHTIATTTTLHNNSTPSSTTALPPSHFTRLSPSFSTDSSFFLHFSHDLLHLCVWVVLWVVLVWCGAVLWWCVCGGGVWVVVCVVLWCGGGEWCWC